ncbi:hypothetical protein CSUB01_04980 [Colletotrichum sublineola]|uniref:Uncharacterized protein n=1 Tax=Colletotrichum sublineola TaxID=1173701 RepID=A0A066X3R2_COLSU|nr:hypothetical protein CSUB01_04980 [Colletotrichum sublineola]
MRVSTLAVAVVSVVALLSSNKAVAAGDKAGKPGIYARSPQDSDVFVSYDYGYSYPAPPPPTTYAELSSSSTVTSLAYSSNASYTEVSSVATVTGTSGVSASVSFSSVVSASATITLSDSAVTSLPTSVTATRSASTGISESLNYTTSFEASTSTSSSDDESGTLASVTDTDIPYTPSTESSDGTISSHSTALISAQSTSITVSPSISSGISVVSITTSELTKSGNTTLVSPNMSALTSSILPPSFTLSSPTPVVSSTTAFSSPESVSISRPATLKQPVETPWPTWNSTMLSAPIQSSQTTFATLPGTTETPATLSSSSGSLNQSTRITTAFNTTFIVTGTATAVPISATSVIATVPSSKWMDFTATNSQTTLATAISVTTLTESQAPNASSTQRAFTNSSSDAIPSQRNYHRTCVKYSSDQPLQPAPELHRNLNGNLEYIRRIIFHFDKCSSIFRNAFINGLNFTDDCAVPVAERNCHCYTWRDDICIDHIRNTAGHLIPDRNSELSMVNVKQNHQRHLERSFLNDIGNWVDFHHLSSVHPFPVNSTLWPSGTIGSVSEAPTMTGPSSSTVNTSSGVTPYPTSNVTSSIGRPTPPMDSSTGFTASWNSTLTTISTSGASDSLTGSTVVVTPTWNNTWKPSLTSVSVTWPTPPQLPNSTWITSANATWTATSRGNDPATSVRMSTVTRTFASVPAWPVSNSTTLVWATGTISTPISTGTVTSGAQSSISSSNLPPWATPNSTVASITGTVSIPVTTSSTSTTTVFNSSLTASFPWTNATFSRPLTSTLTASIITVSEGATTTLWPSNATWTSQVNTTARSPSSTNGTVLQTTEIGTWSLTSTGSSVTLVPSFTAGNSTLVPVPTGVKTSSILLSTVLTGTGATTANINVTFTSTGLPPLPTANSTSSLIATHNATVTVSGSVITLISTLTSVPATLTGSVTGPPVSPTLPPYPTTNSTLISGPTAGGTKVSEPASGTLFQTSEPAETSSGPLVTTAPPFPTGNATMIPGPTNNVSITLISGTAPGSPVSTLTVTRANGNATGIVTSASYWGISSSFSISSNTVGPRPTGTFTGTGATITLSGTGGPSANPTLLSSTWGQWTNTTSSHTSSATSVPAIPSGKVLTATSSNVTISSGVATSMTSSASGFPFSLPPFLNSTTISGAVPTTYLTWTISGTAFSSLSILPIPTPSPSNSSVVAQPSSVTAWSSTPLGASISVSIFPSSISDSRTFPSPSITVSEIPAITNSTGFPAGASTPCRTVTVTNDTVTQIVTRSVFVTTATTSANPTVAYPPYSTNTTAVLSRASCTSRWQNLTSTTSTVGFTSTWTSLVLTNRTSSSLGLATTFITSTTRRVGDPSGGDDGVPTESNFVFGTPTTTITDAPLPSNTAYPWGGLGPIFRPHDKPEPKTGGAPILKLKARKANAAWLF